MFLTYRFSLFRSALNGNKPLTTEYTYRAYPLFFISFFFFFFYVQVLRLYATLWVMTDLKRLYVHSLAWLLPLTFPFLLYLAAVNNCNFWAMPS